jgi:hypothetical protein
MKNFCDTKMHGATTKIILYYMLAYFQHNGDVSLEKSLISELPLLVNCVGAVGNVFKPSATLGLRLQPLPGTQRCYIDNNLKWVQQSTVNEGRQYINN